MVRSPHLRSSLSTFASTAQPRSFSCVPPLHLFVALLLLLLLSPAVLAQSASPTSSPSQTLASIIPSASGYTYIGCYNETTSDAAAGNVRALAGGTMTASNSMTIASCLQTCGTNEYAGLEYTRECWCSPYLNAESQKLPDTNCSLTCSGNASEVCGGPLMLTLYQRKGGGAGTSEGTRATGSGAWQRGWGAGMALGVVGVVMGCL